MHTPQKNAQREQYSVYFITDYTLFKSTTGKSLAAFVQTGYSPVSTAIRHFILVQVLI
jgi:hypothetical protein